jgi:ribosomal protein L35
MKPNKSILKRIKVTKNKKLIRRRAGQNHFNAKESRRVQRRQRELLHFPKSVAREVYARI